MTDVPQLCRQLAVLRRALDAAGTPGRQDDERSHPHRMLPRDDGRQLATGYVAATLTPTPPPANGGRRVPGSRPPFDLTVLEAAREFDAAVKALAAAVRTERRWDLRPEPADAALEFLAAQHEHVASETVKVLHGWNGRLRRVLDLDERWLTLGPCPEIWQAAEPIADTAWVDDVRECFTYDVLRSYDATRRRTEAATRRTPAEREAAWEMYYIAARQNGRSHDSAQAAADHATEGAMAGPVYVWRRSHIRIPRDGDLNTAVADCPGCGRQWTHADRARLSKIVERDAIEQLAAAG